MSNSLPRKAGGAVAMAPGRREDLVGQCGPSRAQGIWRPPRACTLLGEARPGAPPAWRASQGVGASRPLEGETECWPGLSQGEAPA